MRRRIAVCALIALTAVSAARADAQGSPARALTIQERLGAAWRQSDLDLVKSAAFQDFLKQQQFHLITWRELGKARVRSASR